MKSKIILWTSATSILFWVGYEEYNKTKKLEFEIVKYQIQIQMLESELESSNSNYDNIISNIGSLEEKIDALKEENSYHY